MVVKILWLNINIPGKKSKFNFAVVYHHSYDNTLMFIQTLDERFHYLNRMGHKVQLMEDINVNLNSTALSSYTSEYLHMLQSDAFSKCYY